MEKYTIKAPSKRKHHRDGTLSKAEVMLQKICLLSFLDVISPPELLKFADDVVPILHGESAVWLCSR
jgi:hypothetical protein